MRRALRQPLAAVFGLLIVTAAAFGGVYAADPRVNSLDDASNQFVQRGDAVVGTLAVGALGMIVGGAVAYHEFAGKPASSEELDAADSEEAHLNAWQSAMNQKGAADTLLTTHENYAQDTKPIALMKGKRAYVAALQNAQMNTSGDAEVAAHEAINEYYSTKQRNLLAGWNQQVTVLHNAYTVAQQNGGFGLFLVTPGSPNSITGFGNTSVTLTNGTDSKMLGFRDSGSSTLYTMTTPNTASIYPPSSLDASRRKLIESDRWSSVWNSYQSQESTVKDELTSFINATYSEFQDGNISASDFADPYLGARESPQGSEAWSLLTLASMGIAPPENASEVHEMTVTSGGEITRGMLMSDGTPSSGGFSPGETYNTDSLTGPQMVVDENGTISELDGNFTVGNITRPDGSQVNETETVSYQDVNYSTANMSELRDLNQQVQELQAQINARQQRLRNSGGSGWLPDFGSLGLEGIAPIAVIAAGALIALRN